MNNGFVAVSITDLDACVYYVDRAWRDGMPIRPSQPDRHIVHDRAATLRERALESACFHHRVLRALAGAVAILVISQADAAAVPMKTRKTRKVCRRQKLSNQL